MFVIIKQNKHGNVVCTVNASSILVTYNTEQAAQTAAELFAKEDVGARFYVMKSISVTVGETKINTTKEE